jgi:F-type H+-transporting ATPase subunit b
MEHAETVAADAAHHVSEAWYYDTYTWMIASFVIFVALFCKIVLPLILKGLDTRGQAIADQLEQANKLRADAEALLAESKRKQEDAEKEAAALLAQANKDADAMRASAEAELKQAITRRTKQAEDNIKRAESEAVAQIRAQLVDVATEAARQVIVAQLKDQKDDPAVARALAAIERNIH